MKKRTVVIGGGTGTHTVLKGLKRYSDRIDIAAVVSMADSGGSTGRLRDEFGYLPVGDVRMALSALASDVDVHEELLRELFLHRFDKGVGLHGHNVGNLLLVALTDILGSEEQAIAAAGRVLRIAGEVIPVTTETADLVAEYDDGSRLVDEHLIDEPVAKKISSISLAPTVTISKAARVAIERADIIVVGPGDVYTSIGAALAVTGVPEAIRASSATGVYVCNLMTKRGQTDNCDAGAHEDIVAGLIGKTFDHVLVNRTAIDDDLLRRYEAEGELPVAVSTPRAHWNVNDFMAKESYQATTGDVLKRSLIRHDSDVLARGIMDLL